MNWGNNGITLF